MFLACLPVPACLRCCACVAPVCVVAILKSTEDLQSLGMLVHARVPQGRSPYYMYLGLFHFLRACERVCVIACLLALACVRVCVRARVRVRVRAGAEGVTTAPSS